MASRIVNNTNNSQELVINEPTTWDLVNVGEEITCRSATVYNALAWIAPLFAHLQKAAEGVKLLAKAREEENAMEIDISDMRNYYEIQGKNECDLYWQITQHQSFESTLAEESFNEIVRDS
jgi:hypothetical protein